MRRYLLRFTLVATLTVFAALPALSQVLVPRASSWKYLGGGTSPGASWTTLNYDDSAWSSGTAPLGDNLEGTVQYCTTVVNIGPANGRVPSVVFRKKFNVANASIYSALSVRLQRDDGAVV